MAAELWTKTDRSIVKYSGVYVNTSCILYVKYILWPKALSKRDHFFLNKKGAPDQFREQNHCILQEITVMFSIMLLMAYIIQVTRREQLLFSCLEEHSQF